MEITKDTSSESTIRKTEYIPSIISDNQAVNDAFNQLQSIKRLMPVVSLVTGLIGLIIGVGMAFLINELMLSINISPGLSRTTALMFALGFAIGSIYVLADMYYSVHKRYREAFSKAFNDR